MNEVQHKSRTETWLRVFRKEIRYRLDIGNKNPKLYAEMFRQNPKRIKKAGICDKCVFVPATTLWIHDTKKGSVVIDGHHRRGFSEADPFKYEGNLIVPQMCWNCLATREKYIPIIPYSKRRSLAQQIIKDGERKKRRKKVQPTSQSTISSLDELF